MALNLLYVFQFNFRAILKLSMHALAAGNRMEQTIALLFVWLENPSVIEGY